LKKQQIERRRTMTNKKLLIFDSFGVLFTKGFASSIEYLEAAFNKPQQEIESIYRKYEIEFDLGKFTEQDFWAKINHDLGTNIHYDVLSNLVINSYKVKKDTVKLIKFLKHNSNYQIVLFSNFRRSWFDRLDKKYNVSPLFDDVYISSDNGLLKPDTKVFDYIGNKRNTLKDNMLLIDDETINISSMLKWGGKGVCYVDSSVAEKEIRQLFSSSLPRYDGNSFAIILRTIEGAYVFRDTEVSVQHRYNNYFYSMEIVTSDSIKESIINLLKSELSINCASKDINKVGDIAYPQNNSKWIRSQYFLVDRIEINKIKCSQDFDLQCWKYPNLLSKLNLTYYEKSLFEHLEKARSNPAVFGGDLI